VALVLALGVVPAPQGGAVAAPGSGATWTSGAKQGLGTSTTTVSKVWYTLGSGVMNEVFYPKADTPNVRGLEYLVSDGATRTERESVDTTHQIRLPDPGSLTYQQVNTAVSGRYRITKTYVTDPDRSTMLVRTRLQVLSGGPLRLSVVYDPSLGGSGTGDLGATVDGQLVASDGTVASALAASTGLSEASSTGDAAGNLVQTARIPVGMDTTFTLALGFGASTSEAAQNATASLNRGWYAVSAHYAQGWHSYLGSLHAPPVSVTATGLTRQYYTSVMTLKAHEDKTYRGGFVASLSTPWGDAVNADDCCTPGYHAVWARDLYQIATAQIAVGDLAAANRALDYLFTVQQRADGSYPPNTWLDGTPALLWTRTQLDEVAFPTILAWQLGRRDPASWAKVKLSADYLLTHGPSTPQERWEEVSGYSPATIAAEIAALVCAADLAAANHDPASAKSYLDTADSWQRQVESWTYTTTGPLATHGYYQWIDDNGNPNDGHLVTTTFGGINQDERSAVDTGFLELVRLGVKPPNDKHITDSLSVVDSTLKAPTPEGDIWYRHNYDGYGETPDGNSPYTGKGVGRLWPLLAGERGEYALATGQPATTHLQTMAGAANDGGLIPEQVWDRADANGLTFGEGTGSATPLAWAQAQFVRLAVSISAGHNEETPAVVAQRYTGSTTP
jgi:glucoamylase